MILKKGIAAGNIMLPATNFRIPTVRLIAKCRFPELALKPLLTSVYQRSWALSHYKKKQNDLQPISRYIRCVSPLIFAHGREIFEDFIAEIDLLPP